MAEPADEGAAVERASVELTAWLDANPEASLRHPYAEDDEAFERDLRTVLAALKEAREKVGEYERRLEIDRVYQFDAAGQKIEVPVPPAERAAMIASDIDGIGCRDETIKLMRERIDRLTKGVPEILAHQRAASHEFMDQRYDAEAQERRAEKAEARVAELERLLAEADGE